MRWAEVPAATLAYSAACTGACAAGGGARSRTRLVQVGRRAAAAARERQQRRALDLAVPAVAPQHALLLRQQRQGARHGLARGGEQGSQHRMAGQAHQRAALQLGQLQQRARQLAHHAADAGDAAPVGQARVGVQLFARQFQQEFALGLAARPQQGRQVQLADAPRRDRHVGQVRRLLQQRGGAQGLAAARHAYGVLHSIVAAALHQQRTDLDHLHTVDALALALQHLALAKAPLRQVPAPARARLRVQAAQQALLLAGAVVAGMAAGGRMVGHEYKPKWASALVW